MTSMINAWQHWFMHLACQGGQCGEIAYKARRGHIQQGVARGAAVAIVVPL